MLLNCTYYLKNFGITTEGLIIIPLAIIAIIWMLYDLDKINRKRAKELRKELQDLTEKEKQEHDKVKVVYENSFLKPRTRTTVIAVQLSLL